MTTPLRASTQRAERLAAVIAMTRGHSRACPVPQSLGGSSIKNCWRLSVWAETATLALRAIIRRRATSARSSETSVRATAKSCVAARSCLASSESSSADPVWRTSRRPRRSVRPPPTFRRWTSARSATHRGRLPEPLSRPPSSPDFRSLSTVDSETPRSSAASLAVSHSAPLSRDTYQSLRL